MVWAAIVHGYRSPLVDIDGNLNAQRYRVIPLFHNYANISIFQHDNATSYTARDTVSFLRTNTIDFIDDWPAKSPDLNHIEHVWDSLDKQLRRRPNPPELRQALILVWNNIPQAEIQHFSQFYAPAMHSSGQFKRWSYPLLSGFFLTPSTLGKIFSQFLLTYGHDFCIKRCIMEHPLNAYIIIIPPVCFHQVMFKQS